MRHRHGQRTGFRRTRSLLDNDVIRRTLDNLELVLGNFRQWIACDCRSRLLRQFGKRRGRGSRRRRRRSCRLILDFRRDAAGVPVTVPATAEQPATDAYKRNPPAEPSRRSAERVRRPSGRVSKRVPLRHRGRKRLPLRAVYQSTRSIPFFIFRHPVARLTRHKLMRSE